MSQKEDDGYSSLEEYFLDCARYGDLKEIEYCLENKLDLSCVDENKNNAIHMCSANGHVEILKQILESCKENGKQGLLNEQNSAGNTPLHWCTLTNKEESVKQLLEYKCDTNIMNLKREKPFDIAVNFCFTTLVEILAPATEVDTKYMEVDEDESLLVKETNDGNKDSKIKESNTNDANNDQKQQGNLSQQTHELVSNQ